MFICNQTCLKLKNLCIELYIYNIHSIYNLIDVIGIYGEGNGNPLQYSCLESPMGRGTWRATVCGVTRVGHDLVTKSLRPPPH